MPELPDVEAYRRVLDRHAARHEVRSVEVTDSGVLRGVTPRRLRSTLSSPTWRSRCRSSASA